MSDTEFDSTHLGSRVSKSKGKSATVPRSDSEDENVSRRHKSKSTKRKSTVRTSKTAKRRNPNQERDLFGLLSEEEEAAACENASRRAPKSQLPSSISSKTAGGAVVRRAHKDGRYYAEVRLYATRDALDARPETRYTKALVTLKLQLDPDQPEWELLQRFLKKTKTTLFADSAPIFYSDT